MIATLEELKIIRLLRKLESKELEWKNKDGIIIPINEISDDYLDNIINACSKNKEKTTIINPSSLNFY